MSRRQLFAFCSLLFLFFNLAAQTESKIQCSLIKHFTLGKQSLENKISADIHEDVLYFLTQNDCNKTENKLIIHKITIAEERWDSLIINYPSDILIRFIPKFSISNKYLILIDDERSDIYRFIKKGNTFVFLNRVNLPQKYASEHVRHLTKSQFLFHSIYNYHPDENQYNTNFAIYDAERDAIINAIHPDLPCIGFSHLTSSWVANSKTKIAVASPCGYKIFLYDFKLKMLDSIVLNNPQNWNNLPDNTIPFETNPSKIHPKILIDKLIKLNDTISRIEKIFFPDENTLLISSFNGKNNKNAKRIDVWNIKTKPYLISSFENQKINFYDTDTINYSSLPIPLNSPEYLSVNNYSLYAINEEDYFPENNILYKDYKNSKEIYYENHDPQYSIAIYKFCIP